MSKKLVSGQTMFTYVFLTLVCATILFPEIAGASSGSLPWEKPLETLKDSLTGPVAQFVSLIVVVITGLMIGFGEVGGAGKKMLQIVFGIAVGLGGASVIKNVFAVTTGTLF